jgi:hypothetical protein
MSGSMSFNPDDEDIKELVQRVYQERLKKTEEENKIYDQEYEDELERRVDRLGPLVKSEFYRVRANRKESETLSIKELDKLTLEAMERSAKFSDKHQKKLDKVSFDGLFTENEDVELNETEVLFLKYIVNKPADFSYLPGYWTYTYNLNYQAVLKKLFRGGYVDFAPIEYVLKKQSLATLKDLLKQNNLPLKGKKDELVERILSNIAEDQIKESISAKYIVPAGKYDKIEKLADILHYFQNAKLNIGIDEATKTWENHRDANEYEIALMILQDREHSAILEKNISHYRDCLLGQTYVFRGLKQYSDEFRCHLIVCYIDMCGYGNTGVVRKEMCFFAPYFIRGIAHCMKHLDLSYDDIRKQFIEAAKATKIPSKYFFIKTIANKLVDALEDLKNVPKYSKEEPSDDFRETTKMDEH